MADWCASTASTRILYLCEEAVLRKSPRFKSIDCSAEAIHRSSWPIRYCMGKSKPDTQTHPTTVTLRSTHVHHMNVANTLYVSICGVIYL